MKKKENERNINLHELPISDLSLLLIDAHRLDDIDGALQIEELICKKISEDNVEEIEGLLLSKERYCNIAALRILSDSGRVGIEKVYHHIDQLFEKGDRAINGLSLRLIQQHDYHSPAAMKRMAQFISSPDDTIKEIVRVWLLWRSPAELSKFSEENPDLGREVGQFVEILKKFKKNTMSIDVFFDKLSKLDSIAFQEFTRLREKMPRFSYTVFNPEN